VVIDNRVDPTTATVQLKARFANTRRHLWPGQLLNVKLTLETVHDAVVLPSIAVNQGPNGPFTYVVENNLAMLRPLEFDLQQDDITIVKSGVKSGDTVVVEGQGSLRPGAKVAVRGAPNPATVGPSSESRPHA
jgi:multidrug efflux system membrane fusion protein